MNIYVIFIAGVMFGILATTSYLFYKNNKELRKIINKYESDCKKASGKEVANLMSNLSFILGRIEDISSIEETDNHNRFCEMTVGVETSYKNSEGINEMDHVTCLLSEGIAKTVIEYCKPGDLVGIKGSLKNVSKDNNIITAIMAEKVSFLSNKDIQNEAENSQSEDYEM